MNVEKKHDSIMNSLDFSFECSLDMKWLEFANTEEYQQISKAVWRLCSGEFITKEGADGNRSD